MKILLPGIVLIITLFIQNQPSPKVVSGLDLLDSLILEQAYIPAQNELHRQLNTLKQAENYDSLAYYAYYIGKIKSETSDRKDAATELQHFISEMESQQLSDDILVNLYSKSALFYEHIRDYEKSLELLHQALIPAEKLKKTNSIPLAKTYYNISVAYNRTGNFEMGKKFAKKSLATYRQNKKAGNEDLYFASSAMGTAYYYGSAIDSAIYFYEQAQHYASKDSTSPYNRYYRPSLLANNISVLYLMLGQNRKAMEKMQFAIDNNQRFIDTGTDAFKVEESKKWQLSYIENLAGLYEGQGDYKTQAELLLYTLQKRLDDSKSENIEIAITHTLNGQAQFNLLNLTEAENHFQQAIKLLGNENGGMEWQATAYSGLAHIYKERQENDKAEMYFLQAGRIYREMNPEDRDKTEIEFFNDLALFFAETGQLPQALETATDNLDYINRRVGQNGLTAIQQQYILGEIHFLGKNFDQSQKQAELALNEMKRLIGESSNPFDSAQLEFKKSNMSLLRIRSAYENDSLRSPETLETLLNENLEIIDLINHYKQYLYSEQNVQIMIENNRKVYDFAKKLMLELYEKTGKPEYLLKTVDLHEKSLYNRIRNHLNRVDDFRGAGVPEAVGRRESQLKANLNKGIELDSVTLYVQAQEAWGSFLDSLKTHHSNYYHLRYADPGMKMEEIQQKLQPDITVVRYFFIDESLNAVVISKNKTDLIKLENDSLWQKIQQVQDFNTEETKLFDDLHFLYRKLWQPLESYVKTEEVRIIPDGELFNLSFETLTPRKIKALNELSQHSLLARHAISYSFSSFLLYRDHNSADYRNDFVAFAPGFSKELKSDYSSRVKDSVNLDAYYLNLLPQPGAVDLVKKFASSFQGKSFLNENASRNNFTQNAGNNQIIHIATHAESNNLAPELSALVFAKNGEAEDRNENYLYSYQIYDQNLSSEMAVLSACETGKPQKNPGEGMISMAHAFSYAGCKSIVTGLWKMDEKSTSQILDHFYRHLDEGKPKNKALQLAKLDYLASAKGKTVSPAYWSGLVLMGNPAPIEFHSAFAWWWVVAGLLCMGLLIYFLMNRSKNRVHFQN